MYFLVDYCQDLNEVVVVAKKIFEYIRFGVPILLIIFGALDLAKAVISSKEDEMKKAQSTLIKRLLYAAVIFLLVSIVGLVIGTVSKDNAWKDCWNNTKII